MANINQVRAACAKSVVTLGKIIRPSMAKVASPPFHDDINYLWKSGVKKLNTIAPRGHAKSELCGANIPIDHILHDDGDKFIVLVSKSLSHAQDLLRKITDVLDYSKEFRALYGYYGQNSPHISKWTITDVQFKFYNWRTKKWENIRILAKGMNQQLVGLNHLSQRPTLAIFDDPEDTNNTKTLDRMADNFKSLQKDLIPGLDPIRGRILVIGTPQHSQGMVNKLEELAAYNGEPFDIGENAEGYRPTKNEDGNRIGWVSIHYDAVVNESEKKVLWPEWVPWDKLESERKDAEFLGKLSTFMSEYRCKIISDNENIFLPQDMRYYEGHVELDDANEAALHITAIGSDRHKLSPVDISIGINIYTGIDPASSTSKTADNSVTLNIGYDKQGRIFVLPYFAKRVKPYDHMLQILENHERWKPKSTQVEAVQYQEMLRDLLQRESRERGIYIPGLERKYTTSGEKKELRLQTLEGFFRNHQVYMQPDMEQLRDELLLFPRAKHDDLVDGLYYATRRLLKPDHSAKKIKIAEPTVFKPKDEQPKRDTKWMTRI